MSPRLALLSILAAAGSTLVGPMVQTAQAQDCSPPRMMMILDKSSSMQTGTINGETKWEIAVNAMDTVVSGFQDQLELGLTLFPDPMQCAPGAQKVAPALMAHTNIMAELADPPPTGGNYTPMAQTLEAAAQEPSMQGPGPKYAVLITDGWQWCDPYDPATRFAPVQAVEDMNAAGITTYVVGFGSSIDAATLNQVAVTAGTAIPGCDPSGTSATDPTPCYYQADDPTELIDALNDIAGEVAGDELCDGEDNDCDGLVDEDVVQACSTACGSGVQVCTDGAFGECDAPQPEEEVCDGLDNDCDGTIDPGCECQQGETRSCGTEEVCQPGTQTCGTDGTWGACEGAVEPGAEMCDGDDNDCDGFVDEMTDDVGGLCGIGQTCTPNGCEDLPPEEPPVDEEDPGLPAADGGAAAGCGCQTTGGAPESGSLLLLLGTALMLRRRRKKQ